MNTRIKQVRIQAKLNQVEFGERIGLGQAGVSALEKGIRGITDRNIQLICKEFNINEEWLRTGQGDMYKLVDDKLAAYVSELTDSEDEFLKNLIIYYMELNESDKEVIRSFFKGILERKQ